MIHIKNDPNTPQTLVQDFPPNSVEQSVFNTLMGSSHDYEYDSADELRFELQMRAATVKAARDLNRSGMDFAIFRKTKCNPEYWERMDDGGFALKRGVRPSEAILDIYRNGRSYATECATAIVIVFYKAALDVLSAEVFDRLFPRITLMNWHNIDPIFRGIGVMRHVHDYLPGDRRYFMNPDVNPETPEWQGENVIMLDTDSFYGHGIGIGSGAAIIEELNKNRRKNADETAYLMTLSGRPDYRNLYALKKSHDRS